MTKILLTNEALSSISGGGYALQTNGALVPFPEGGEYAFSKEQTMVGLKNGTAAHLNPDKDSIQIVVI